LWCEGGWAAGRILMANLLWLPLGPCRGNPPRYRQAIGDQEEDGAQQELRQIWAIRASTCVADGTVERSTRS